MQEHLDAQEHIWNTSGTALDKTGHHLQMWHNSQDDFQTMALLESPDTPPMTHMSTKFQQPSGTPCMWAPTPKNLNTHN